MFGCGIVCGCYFGWQIVIQTLDQIPVTTQSVFRGFTEQFQIDEHLLVRHFFHTLKGLEYARIAHHLASHEDTQLHNNVRRDSVEI